MGLNTDLNKPVFETRMAILDSKSSDEEIQLPFEVQELICTNIKTVYGNSKGVLISLAA